ncbi:MAG: sugar phosphate isomerase/epimerase [Devosia sp.]
MKIGFYTSTFNDRPAEEVFDFAADAGFDAIEIDIGGHVKSPDNVAKTVDAARSRGLYVSSVILFGNQLDPDPAGRRERRDQTKAYAKAVADTGVPIFVVFPGRDNTASEDDNYKNFADHAVSLLDGTDTLNVAFENWPGMDDDFIATTPAGWAKLFALAPDERLGLEFDPSHLIRLGIDPFDALDGVKDRVKILHGKDASIDESALQQVGYHGAGWWRYVLPGRGLLDWPKFLTAAKDHGFDDVVSIEHEDSDFGWPKKDLEARREGERQGLAFLRAAAGRL